jgi:hypothetical protein
MKRFKKKIFNEFNFFVVLIVFWSFYFLNSTIKLEDGKESVLLIKPLFYLLAITSIFVILETFIKGLKTSGELFEKKKIYFLTSVLIFFVAINYFGYILSAFLFCAILSYLLGSKVKSVFFPACLSVIIIFLFFHKLLKIPLPLW